MYDNIVYLHQTGSCADDEKTVGSTVLDGIKLVTAGFASGWDCRT